MYSKTLAVFLFVCLTQGLVNGSKLTKTKNDNTAPTLDIDSAIKNIETQSKEEYLVEQITKQLLALLGSLRDKTFQSKAAVCDPDVNPLKIVAIQLLQCGQAFEMYKNESKCDGKINEFSKDFSKLANITSYFVHNIKSEENKTINDEIHNLIAAIIWDYEQYFWCEGLKPKPHTSDELEFCQKHLKDILLALKEAIDQCSNNPVITYQAKTGEDNEFEFYQLVSWFHLWLNASANDVHSCPSVHGDLAHLRNAWESLHKALLEISEAQEDQSECKNATQALASGCYDIKTLMQTYMDNHPNSDWLTDSNLKAIELGLNKNKVFEACPHVKENIVNIINNAQKQIMDIQAEIHNKVDHCRQQAAAAQSTQVQAAKQVKSVKKRSVDCEELENYLIGEIYKFAEEIKTKINDKIKNTDCKNSLINNIDDVKEKVYIITQIKDYSDDVIKGFLQAIENDLRQIPYACQNIDKSDYNNLKKIAEEVYYRYKQELPKLKIKLEELQQNCPRPVK